MSETKTVSVGQIGRSLPRVEARAKVTGRAEYVHNLRLPGMLWAKIARSTVPHGRIRHNDTSAVQATHGVYSVIPSLPARTSSGSSRTRISGRHFTISRSWRSEKCDSPASRSPSSWPKTQRSPKRRHKKFQSITRSFLRFSMRSRR